MILPVRKLTKKQKPWERNSIKQLTQWKGLRTIRRKKIQPTSTEEWENTNNKKSVRVGSIQSGHPTPVVWNEKFRAQKCHRFVLPCHSEKWLGKFFGIWMTFTMLVFLLLDSLISNFNLSMSDLCILACCHRQLVNPGCEIIWNTGKVQVGSGLVTFRGLWQEQLFVTAFHP